MSRKCLWPPRELLLQLRRFTCTVITTSSNLIVLAVVSFTRMYHLITRETPEVMLLPNKKNLETSKMMICLVDYNCGSLKGIGFSRFK